MPTDDEWLDLGPVLADFAQVVGHEHGVVDILESLGDYCTQLLPVHGIGVLLNCDDGLTVATYNTEEGHAVERLEAELKEGPCTDAVRTGTQIRVPDVEAAVAQYPRFVPRALDAGIRAVWGLPMTARREVVGALDVVAKDPTELSPAQLSTAQVLADVAMAYLANVRAREATSRLADQLQHALDSRVVIEQAKGKLAERHGEGTDEAFARIRRHARSKQRTVRAVAEDVLAGEIML